MLFTFDVPECANHLVHAQVLQYVLHRSQELVKALVVEQTDTIPHCTLLRHFAYSMWEEAHLGDQWVSEWYYFPFPQVGKMNWSHH